MAQQQSVLGIFGLTPELYAQRQQDLREAEQMATAKMSAQPGTLLNPSMANIYAQATQEGQLIGQGAKAIGGLLGIQDPQLAMISEVTELRKNFDVSTPQGLKAFASALAPKYPELAIQAAAKAADIDKTLAEAEAKRTDKIKQVGLTTEGKQVYQSGTEQFVLGPGGTKEPYYGKLESKTPKTEIKMPGQKQIYEVESKRAEKIQKELDSGYTVLERLKEQELAIKNGVIGGSFADTRTKLATLGAALGIADPKLIESLANTRSFKANENALGAAIAKQLGVNPTDKDFVASLDQFARNSDDPRAALIFIEQLQDKFGKRVKINEDMMNVYLDPETGGSFRNYKGPKMIEPFTKPADELQQLLKEKADRAKKKNTKE